MTSAGQIEVDTSFTFFTAVPSNIASILRNKIDGQTNPPLVIFAFSPPAGLPSTNIIITGTNFTAASAVNFDEASAVFTLDSAAPITAVMLANAGTGFISVATVL